MLKKLLIVATGMFVGNAAYAVTCDAGNKIENGECVACPAGTVSPGGTSTSCSDCSWLKYANDDQSACVSCPPQYPAAPYRSKGIGSCFRVCMGGTHMASTSDTECTPVGADEFAPLSIYFYGRDSANLGTLHKCPAGTYSRGEIGYGADDETDCARILHVGENTIRMTRKQASTPALALGMDGTVYYARMSETSHPMSANTTATLNIAYDNKHYYAYDDTIQTRAPYPWESMDFDWYEQGTYTYNNSAQTWTVTFRHDIWSGDTRCDDDGACYYRMLVPAVSEWMIRAHYGANCNSECPLNAAWGIAYSAEHKRSLLSVVRQ